MDQLHISQAEAVNLIRSSYGRLFGVEFIKKDGSTRKMLARLGVRKGTKGSGPSTTAHIPRYITVWSRHDKDFRTINVTTIQGLSLAGNRYTVA